MYNKKTLSKAVKNLGSAKAPAKKKDIILDQRGQWEHAGEITRILGDEEGTDITMTGVPYPVYGEDNTGYGQMMYPNNNYTFPGDYVDEYPQMAEEGIEVELTDKEIQAYRDGGYIVEELPKAQDGITYTYKGRPEAKYKKDSKGNWLISTPDTKGKFIPIDDSTGSRTKVLNAQATPINTYDINSGKWQVNNGVWTQLSDDATVSNAHMRDRESAYVKGKSERLFKNITPQGYGDIAQNLDRYARYQKNAGRNKNDLIWYGAEDSPTGKPTYYTIPHRDDMFSLYLGLPQQNNSFAPQLMYRPTNEKDPNSLYYKPTYWTPQGQQALLDQYLLMNDLNKGIYNERSTVLEPIYDSLEQAGVHHSDPRYGSAAMDNPLGDFTVTQGKDDKGTYISIYDKIDFNPFQTGEGASVNPKALALQLYMKSQGYDVSGDTEGSSLIGAGKPYEIYDRIYYDDKTKKIKKQDGGLIKAQEGGQKDKWGRSLSDKWYGFDPQTKKYTIAPYKIEELRRKTAGVSKYDPLQQKGIPTETTQQTAKNLPSQKKSMNEAMVLKAIEKDATVNAVKELPLITEDQRNEILMDPKKLEEYSYLTRLQDPDTVQESIPYSARERVWDVITNPFDAFEYSVRTGDISNMPRNYNKMRMAGIDPSAGGGANAVGNALNMTTNLFDAGDKVVRNIGEGNYGTAALEAMRFLPGARLNTGVGKYLTTQTPLKNAYKINPRAFNTPHWLKGYKKVPISKADDVSRVGPVKTAGLNLGYNKPSFTGPMVGTYQDRIDILKALNQRGQYWDNANLKGKDILHKDMINYHGTYSGRPIVEVKMPDGSSEMFYKSSGWAGKQGAGKQGTTEGMWQVYGGHADDSNNWFIKDDNIHVPGLSYKDYYGSKTFREMAEAMDEALMQKYSFQNIDELDNAFNFQNRFSDINSYTPSKKKNLLYGIGAGITGSGVTAANYKDYTSGGTLELELLPEEIQWYIDNGYTIEDL